MQSRDHRRTALRCAVIVMLLSVSAHADDSRERSRRRLLHLTISASLGVAWLASDTVLKSSLVASQCRWCAPPSFDASVRNAVVWHDTATADILSSIDVYAVAPAVGFGLLYVADHDAGWTRLLDDTIPVAESIAVGQVLTQAIKFSVGRQRPYARYGAAGRVATNDDNTSFISGHSVLGFSITASAGLICHWRHYKTEPYVWGAGIALSLSTEYLRMSADKHYLSDVLVGGGVGIATGLLVPRLMRENIEIVPTSNGFAVTGAF
jgi:membrane-associated phospholipid phosphatase